MKGVLPLLGPSGGVNEKDPITFTATASTIPSSLWKGEPVERRFTTALLTDCANCDEIPAKKVAIFPSLHPAVIIIADCVKILMVVMVEVRLKGKSTVKVVENGVIVHSNHFHENSPAEFNIKVGESRRKRFERITHLKKTTPRPFTPGSFAAMRRDENDGPDNSQWRTGKSSQTLASWIVEAPVQGPAKRRGVLAHPGEPEQTYRFMLDEKFWRETK